MEGLGQIREVEGILLALDKEVIHIDFHTLPNQTLEHVIDQMLAGCPCVLEAKGHYLVAVGSPVGDEGSFSLITGEHADLVISEVSIHEGHERVAGRRVYQEINTR